MSHFYDKEGSPVYQVPYANGIGLRDTTLRDAKKLNLQPSVTTVTGVLDKAGLLSYFHEQVIKAVLAQPCHRVDEEFKDYVNRIVSASKEESKKASERGGELHNWLEKYFKDTKCHFTIPTEISDFIDPIINEISQLNLKNNLSCGSWQPELSFSHPLGFGGRVDLCCLAGQGIVIDFKTKNTTDKKKFYKYDEHLMQLAAYREGLEIPNARCYDIYFSSVEPNIIEVHEWTEEDLQRGWKMFQNLLSYWQLKNKYDSSFKLPEVQT